MDQKPALYFRGLNGLRFFAALLVLFSHGASFLGETSQSGILDVNAYSFFDNGSIAVKFFFVLSGFLITSLLLEEYDATKTIRIKKFYARRALRIWPLYYFVVFIAFTIFPILQAKLNLRSDPGLGFPQLIMYIFLIPNLTFILGPRFLLFHLWSIGVEEQFYLLIAPLIKYTRKKLTSILICMIILKLVLNNLFNIFLPNENVTIFILDLNFETISIGCLGAIFIRSKYKSLLKKIFSYTFQLFAFGVLFAILFFSKTIQSANFSLIDFFSNTLFNRANNSVFIAVLFLYILLCISLNNKSIIRTDNRVLDFLGNLSYGMYMYHVMAGFAIAVLLKNFLHNYYLVTATIIYFLLYITVTILISFLSYNFFEKRFLKMKRKFH